ncbi:glyceraldehyde-3-phosphate dehydrogenase [Moraxella nasovis]|uniref:type I glyceraldehyde-3-phosphate dehydrogenase n=1 Tax=Moraxella nasovis TaxID=2904121 RepID=UPI001F6128BA|nr:type I glyceraldehyde-3-phosphate dehydrogenase [Moraxella nasovis]UNU72872.1 glyceraldehyde-3-phosphate dehydrogenase [Moraxella nasovis]
MLTPKIRLAINGFGRIGRNVLRAYLKHPDKFLDVEIVAINDVADASTLLHLLKFDTTHGRLSALGVSAQLGVLDGRTALELHTKSMTSCILFFNESEPKNLAWRDLAVDVVLECTGKFRSYHEAMQHRQAGARQVIVGAAPFDEIDASVVIGVNDHLLTRDLPIISSVSCTTQALVPLLSVLHDNFCIKSAMMTEIHAVTADQSVLDQAHRDLRRARACGQNIIPTTSSSINATERVLPDMQGKINGHSIRVPTLDVAAIDVNFTFMKSASLSQLQDVLYQASIGKLSGIMGYTDEPLVSSDFIGDLHSLVIDGTQIMQAGEQFKVFAWYDNEWGYANRLLDMCQILAKR